MLELMMVGFASLWFTTFATVYLHSFEYQLLDEERYPGRWPDSWFRNDKMMNIRFNFGMN